MYKNNFKKSCLSLNAFKVNVVMDENLLSYITLLCLNPSLVVVQLLGTQKSSN